LTNSFQALSDGEQSFYWKTTKIMGNMRYVASVRLALAQQYPGELLLFAAIPQIAVKRVAGKKSSSNLYTVKVTKDGVQPLGDTVPLESLRETKGFQQLYVCRAQYACA
jgi:hypothetical protein